MDDEELQEAAAKGKALMPRFAAVTLLANEPRALLPFYRDVLELPTHFDRESLFVSAGITTLRFDPAPGGMNPSYHFAFNVSKNLLDDALRWLKERWPIVRSGGREVFQFESWNAQAFYFLDPSCNILEFIARQNLENRFEGPFSAQNILSVSEVGLVVKDVPGKVASLQLGLGLKPYGMPTDDFAAVGDEEGLLIVVREGREWFASDGLEARGFPMSVQLAGDSQGSAVLQSWPRNPPTTDVSP